MNKDYGIKIAVKGKSVLSTDVRDLQFSSKYSMLKYHKEMTGSATLTPGDTEAYVDFEHQLGYVPAFMSYGKSLWNNAYYFIPGIPYPTGWETPGDGYLYTFADSNKIRCGVQIVVGAYNQSGPLTCYMLYDDRLDSTIGMRVGETDGALNGACLFSPGLFQSFPPQGTTITEAILAVAVGSKGDGVGNLKAKIFGIDEDNTADFSSDPMGRPQTTAVDIAEWSLPPAGEYSNHNVTSIVQEIVNRAGWNTGNNMGFLLFDNGSPEDVYIEDDINVGIDTKLTIKYGSNTTLTFRTIIFKNKIA